MKIILRKRILASWAAASHKDGKLFKEIELPFVPFVGLFIWGDDFEATITEISWGMNNNQMECFTEDNKEIYNALGARQRHRTVEEVVNDYIEIGWERE